MRTAALAACVLLGAGVPAGAMELYSGDGLDLRWDNTLRYNAAFRVEGRSPALLARNNADDGDRNFAPGLVSNRLDLVSQLDLAAGDMGFHASAAGWYDSVYQSGTGNTSQDTFNGAPAPSDRFAPAVRDLHGQHVELATAFAYGSVSLAGTPVTVRLGRQSVLWGESLFYDPNDIASAMAPSDYSRGPAVQDGYSSDIYLPVAQLFATAQILPNLAVSFYDQFEARTSRLAGDGSYLSYTDFLGPGANRLFLRSGGFLSRESDGRASAGGQYGIAVSLQLDGADLGFYALRFNSRDPLLVIGTPDANTDPLAVGYYRAVYPKKLELFGMSFSTSLMDSTFAGEISARPDTPLLYFPNIGVPAGGYAGYVRGDLVHLQLSDSLSLGPGALWDNADLSMEFAADKVMGADAMAGNDPNWNDSATRARILFEPHYFEVAPGLALTTPIGVGYNISGRGYNYYAQNAQTGDLQVGVRLLYRSAWKASLMYHGFIGSPASQPLADRGFINLSLERTF